MSSILYYVNGNQSLNIANLVKGSTDKPSFIIDWTDALRTTAVTVQTTGTVALGSTGATATTLIVGTTQVVGNTSIVDLRTGGTLGTGTATNGDQWQVRVTAVLSSGGPVYYDLYVKIVSPAYLPI